MRNKKLDAHEKLKYSRQLLIPEIGSEGQMKLKKSSVLIVGTGGLGSPLALYLTAAGIGRLGLVDSDSVEDTNLNRQILYNEQDIGKQKVAIAKEKLTLLNRHVEIETYPIQLIAENAAELMQEYDVIADGTDNFSAKYLINDTCVQIGKVDVYGSVYRCEGQV